MLDVGRLATLRAVVRHGSFSAAADALALTQPAVSRQVALLEREVGQLLVRRTNRGIRPTPAGRLLVDHADVVLRQLARAEQELAELRGIQRGHVRLGTFFTAFAQLTPEICALVELRFPDLVVTHELVDRSTAFAQLRSGDLDLAVVFEQEIEPDPPSDDVDLVPLFVDPLRVLLPSNHRLAQRTSVSLADLAGDTWVRPSDGSAARLVDAVLDAIGIRPALLTAGQGDEPVETQVFVAAGEAVSIAYDLNVIINRDRIVARPIAGFAPVRRIQAAAPRMPWDAATRAMVELLRDLGEQHARRLAG